MITIILRCLHEFLLLSRAIRPYYPSFLLSRVCIKLLLASSWWSANSDFVWKVHRRMSLMNSSLLLQRCLECLVRLIWMVLEMVDRWPYSSCFVRCCCQDLFNIARSILMQFPPSLFSIRLVSVYVVHPYSRINTTTAGKKLRFILSDRSSVPIWSITYR